MHMCKVIVSQNGKLKFVFASKESKTVIYVTKGYIYFTCHILLRNVTDT